MHIYEKEFDFVIQRAKSLERPARMVVAGADCDNVLKAVFEAQAQGFGRPVLEPAVLPDGTIGPRHKMIAFLTFDHQVIDGLECGRIFKDIQYYLEHPELILV